MAEFEEQISPTSYEEEPVPKSKIWFINYIFDPKNLKKLVIYTAGIIVLFIVVMILWKIIDDKRPPELPYYYDNLKLIKFTSDKKPYGTFFCSTKVVLGYLNKNITDEIEERQHEVLDTIIQTISEQNYYMIDTVEKRKENLEPKIVERLNLLLRTKGGIQEVNFQGMNMVINEESRDLSYTYFPLEVYYVNLNKIKYKIEMYAVFDASSIQFNRKLKNSYEKLIQKIREKVEKNNLNINTYDIRQSKRKLNSIVDREVSLFFDQLELSISNENPLYSKKKRLKHIVFTLFKKSEI